MSDATLTINSRAYDGQVRKKWKAELLDHTGALLIAKGVFDTEIVHPHLGVIRRGTVSYEYFWLDRWYNVFRFQERDGAFRNYYCNVCMPATLNGAVLDYIDLDIDIVSDAAGRLVVLDEDEFAENAGRFGFSKEVHDKAAKAVAELIRMIEHSEFPFGQFEPLHPDAG